MFLSLVPVHPSFAESCLFLNGEGLTLGEGRVYSKAFIHFLVWVCNLVSETGLKIMAKKAKAWDASVFAFWQMNSLSREMSVSHHFSASGGRSRARLPTKDEWWLVSSSWAIYIFKAYRKTFQLNSRFPTRYSCHLFPALVNQSQQRFTCQFPHYCTMWWLPARSHVLSWGSLQTMLGYWGLCFCCLLYTRNDHF